jgi:hypothetical protein
MKRGPIPNFAGAFRPFLRCSMAHIWHDTRGTVTLMAAPEGKAMSRKTFGGGGRCSDL